MRKITKLFCVAALLMGFAQSSFAQVTDVATASAVIIAPISVAKTADMDFGTLAVNTNNGTVDLGTDGSLSVLGGVTIIGGTPTAAVFHVAGTVGESYYFNLPASVTLSDGALPVPNTMIVDNFVHTASLIIPAGGEDVNVGATLNVTGSQAPGNYTNTTDLIVTVNYN